MEASGFTYENYNFAVDEFFDFSNVDDDAINWVSDGNDGAFNSTLENSAISLSSVDISNSLSRGDREFSGEIYAPENDLTELEWLSNFPEEDSLSAEDYKNLQLISGIKAGSDSVSGWISNSSASETRDIKGVVTGQQPTKARSKLPRNAPTDWSSRLLFPTESDVNKCPKPVKRKEPSRWAVSSDDRRCLHCETDKIPQCRAGPKGPKTLCNACGVRYKKARLVEEYRPAANPTFVMTKNSNSHRKVLELRREKEMQMQRFVDNVMGNNEDYKF